ncbi:OmpH family outer membrane protein [Anatilimnocola floriformis]|uniref:OmpH family outer membrane protein n=1 Tax=Anatilimnocola floriformis TaxID=2948575 RepID=UPI0020C43489|nr:OmpH family outer membrane protein [Anatilimnocola floriformis]
MRQLSWKVLCLAALAAAVAWKLADLAQAAPEGADTVKLPPSVVAVIDVAKVFEKADSQITKMKELKADVDTFDAAVKTAAAEIKESEEKRKLLPAGSDEAAQAELQNKQQVLAMQSKIAQKKAEFLKREGEVYFDTYTEMERAIKLVARKRGVTMVIRQGNETMNRGDRDSVLKGVNRAIVYAHEDNDVTEAVIAAMKP